jgi:predicted aconitase with swiveling domain
MSERVLEGKFYVAGKAEGDLVKSERPISFWGGLDPEEGKIIDRRSDVAGRKVAGKILAFPEGIGSSTTSAVLLESVMNSTNPRAIVNVTTEPILVSGALLAKEFYGTKIPVVSIKRKDFDELEDGAKLAIDGDRGTVTVV